MVQRSLSAAKEIVATLIRHVRFSQIPCVEKEPLWIIKSYIFIPIPIPHINYCTFTFDPMTQRRQRYWRTLFATKILVSLGRRSWKYVSNDSNKQFQGRNSSNWMFTCLILVTRDVWMIEGPAPEPKRKPVINSYTAIRVPPML